MIIYFHFIYFIYFSLWPDVVAEVWGPVHTYLDIFESASFSFRIWLLSTRIQRIRQRIWIFLYVWMGKFLNLERKSCGFKNIWIHKEGALSGKQNLFWGFVLFCRNLFCYITNHLMTGLLGNREFCFPRISMFPSTWSRETLRFEGNKIHPLLSVNC